MLTFVNGLRRAAALLFSIDLGGLNSQWSPSSRLRA